MNGVPMGSAPGNGSREIPQLSGDEIVGRRRGRGVEFLPTGQASRLTLSDGVTLEDGELAASADEADLDLIGEKVVLDGSQGPRSLRAGRDHRPPAHLRRSPDGRSRTPSGPDPGPSLPRIDGRPAKARPIGPSPTIGSAGNPLAGSPLGVAGDGPIWVESKDAQELGDLSRSFEFSATRCTRLAGRVKPLAQTIA